jgi:hypothetical protein
LDVISREHVRVDGIENYALHWCSGIREEMESAKQTVFWGDPVADDRTDGIDGRGQKDGVTDE